MSNNEIETTIPVSATLHRSVLYACTQFEHKFISSSFDEGVINTNKNQSMSATPYLMRNKQTHASHGVIVCINDAQPDTLPKKANIRRDTSIEAPPEKSKWDNNPFGRREKKSIETKTNSRRAFKAPTIIINNIIHDTLNCKEYGVCSNAIGFFLSIYSRRCRGEWVRSQFYRTILKWQNY